MTWYEDDGTGRSTAQSIDTTVEGAASVYATGLDGDIDTGILSASQDDDTIAWHEPVRSGADPAPHDAGVPP